MKKIFPINTTADGTAFTVTTRIAAAGFFNITGGGSHYPSTGVIEVYEDDNSDQYRGRDVQMHNDQTGTTVLGELPWKA